MGEEGTYSQIVIHTTCLHHSIPYPISWSGQKAQTCGQGREGARGRKRYCTFKRDASPSKETPRQGSSYSCPGLDPLVLRQKYEIRLTPSLPLFVPSSLPCVRPSLSLLTSNNDKRASPTSSQVKRYTPHTSSAYHQALVEQSEQDLRDDDEGQPVM